MFAYIYIYSQPIHVQRFATDGQSVLGTVMFTCSGRGPHKHFFGRSDYDAQIYRGEFPNAPLLGCVIVLFSCYITLIYVYLYSCVSFPLLLYRCYVDGEIGPQLLGDVDREATLFASSSTQSSAQVGRYYTKYSSIYIDNLLRNSI